MKLDWIASTAAAVLMVTGVAAPALAHDHGDTLSAVLEDPRRDNDRARDVYRNPGETLAFFEVEPDHVVVEALPGGGWYSRVLAPYVREEGGFIGINYPMDVFEQIFGDRLNDDAFRARLENWDSAFPGRVSDWCGSR